MELLVEVKSEGINLKLKLVLFVREEHTRLSLIVHLKKLEENSCWSCWSADNGAPYVLDMVLLLCWTTGGSIE